MPCWPVYIVGGFFISLLLVDMATYSWDSLPTHAGLGIVFTGLYYIFCILFGDSISMAVLFVPMIFILMFFLASWLLYNNIQANHCCMTCGSSQSSGSAPSSKYEFPDFLSWMFGNTTATVATASPLPTCPPTSPSPSH